MQFATGTETREQALVGLFTATFTASEGAEEGARIGQVVRELIDSTPPGDLHAFQAEDRGVLLGAIFFSRLSYPADGRNVFILSPVAVDNAHQGQGVGQKLIRYGLNALRDQGVDVATTYGDPAFYSRVGFQPITEQIAQAPLPLSFPHGWLGQSLTEHPLTPLAGTASCVPALNHPDLW